LAVCVSSGRGVDDAVGASVGTSSAVSPALIVGEGGSAVSVVVG
jgi:hypothetical protein